MAVELTARARRARRVAALLALATLLFGVPAAMAEGRRAYGQSLTASLLEEPRELDPLQAQTHTEVTMVSLLFDRLYEMREGQLAPSLASAMPDQSNPLLVHLPIREGVAFHSGGVLQPRDVALSLERLRSSHYGYLLDSVQSIEVGASELVLHMRQADPTLARRLADVHASVTEGGRAPTWRRVLGSGVFRLQQRSASNREVRLSANDSYFGGRSYIDQLVLRWFEEQGAEARRYETGEAQLSLRGDIAFPGHRPKYRTASNQGDPQLLAYLGFGSQDAITADAEFRHALSEAIGRSGMQQVTTGEKVVPTKSVLPARTPVRQNSDMRTASRLMAALARRYSRLEAGTLTLDLLVNKSRPDDAAIADRVAAALFHFGIRTKRVELDAQNFMDRTRSGKCDLFIGQLALAAPSTSDLIRAAFVAGRRWQDLRALAGQSEAKLVQSFDSQLPLVPLFHRGLRVHSRSDVQATGFAPGLRLRFEDLFFFGLPEKN